ncbi:response regulator [Labilithrix luteola]|nr:response regulator [Labilithrix luteola]
MIGGDRYERLRAVEGPALERLTGGLTEGFQFARADDPFVANGNELSAALANRCATSRSRPARRRQDREVRSARAIPAHLASIAKVTCPALVDGDASALASLVMNLVQNSAGPMDAEKGAFTIDGGTSKHGVPSRAYVPVTDTGIGMSETTRMRMFDPFFTTTPDAHGGGIDVASQRGSGTKVAAQVPPASTDAGKAKAERGKGRNVLVVDDEPSLRRSIRMVLTGAGFETLEAKHGAEAVALVSDQANVIDAVLVDRSMPGMSGEDAVRAMRTIRPSIPVVLMSGFDRGSDLDNVATIAKPFDPESLIALVLRVIDEAHHEEPR